MTRQLECAMVAGLPNLTSHEVAGSLQMTMATTSCACSSSQRPSSASPERHLLRKEHPADTPRSVATPLRSRRRRDALDALISTPITPRTLELDLARLVGSEASPSCASSVHALTFDGATTRRSSCGIRSAGLACDELASISEPRDLATSTEPDPSSPVLHQEGCHGYDHYDTVDCVEEIPVLALLVTASKCHQTCVRDPREVRRDQSFLEPSLRTIVIPASISSSSEDRASIGLGRPNDPRKNTRSVKVAPSKSLQTLTPCKRLLSCTSPMTKQPSETYGLISVCDRSPTPGIEERPRKLRSARGRSPTPTPSKMQR
jgi:hypothetical protein